MAGARCGSPPGAAAATSPSEARERAGLVSCWRTKRPYRRLAVRVGTRREALPTTRRVARPTACCGPIPSRSGSPQSPPLGRVPTTAPRRGHPGDRDVGEHPDRARATATAAGAHTGSPGRPQERWAGGGWSGERRDPFTGGATRTSRRWCPSGREAPWERLWRRGRQVWSEVAASRSDVRGIAIPQDEPAPRGRAFAPPHRSRRHAGPEPPAGSACTTPPVRSRPPDGQARHSWRSARWPAIGAPRDLPLLLLAGECAAPPRSEQA